MSDYSDTYIRVIWDDQDPANPGWAYQVYDGDPRQSHAAGHCTLTESGALDESDSEVEPTVESIISQVGLPIDQERVYIEA